jgi:hypothetical protein
MQGGDDERPSLPASARGKLETSTTGGRSPELIAWLKEIDDLHAWVKDNLSQQESLRYGTKAIRSVMWRSAIRGGPERLNE